MSKQKEIMPSRLPIPLTSLVGREAEVSTICTLLACSDLRLLTLTGMGGVGKTRLALSVANQLQKDFPAGVYFVSLASIGDVELVLPALVQALGLSSGEREPLELLQAELATQRLLLVLDNFEHVIAAAPSLVQLLTTCPDLKLLVTSREVLHVRGEREFVVMPLALPDPQDLSTGEALARSSAVTLFLERAREVQPALQLNALTAPLLGEICRRLDGLPLALELAAARLKVLSLHELLDRLSHRLDILTGGPRDLPGRQQTLRQTISWSYELLSDDEKRLFRLLAVFVNGCTLEAAEVVYSRVGGERAQVLDGITSLLNKHLLYKSEQENHQPRWLLHETLREYALEVLAASGELEKARQVHAEYYLGLTAVQLEGVELTTWLTQLQDEYPNLRAAMQWVLQRPEQALVLRLESVLLNFWAGHQRLSECQNLPKRTIEHGQALPVPRSTTEALASQPPGHKPDATKELKAVALQGEARDTYQLVRSLYLFGIIAWIIGDFAVAHMYAQQGLTRARGTEDKFALAYLLDLAGQIALDQDEDSRARTLLEEGLRWHREAGDRLGCMNSLFFLERLHLSLNDMARARAYAEEHLALARTLGYQSGLYGTLVFLGRLALEEGNATRAQDLFVESLSLLRGMRENLVLAVAINLQGIGISLATCGRLREAVRLWGAARALCALLPEERAFVRRARAKAWSELGEVAFDAAWAEGQALTLEQAMDTMEHIALSGLPSAQTDQGALHDLTAREEEVLRLVARGLTDAQIAEALVISPRTVNAHLRSIYTKLQISSRHAATYFALKHGLI
ncbi:hypothetical protein EPA93_07045 [Ktedonosporobacter rubrisoli]|uniref:HTH luxR-type domain-containing protein n=1 Tax=Ktedonosporobacter rubrisoli TaxID=2509675 RepID=A0A4P6JL22_KTERU|nr:LuxR C-terminal-related transcriptional regulator [Ktedonosporobacter rubrisoli]QBD75773.1 hypothetical protein EPA93_07045 [Ktedonosporobacter rubrisoli]